MLTREDVLNVLKYDKNEGKLLRRYTRGTGKAGTEAGSILETNGNKYVTISINNKQYFAHRLIWLIEMGHWPDKNIDHLDGNGLNNKISNLRLASHVENGRNMRRKRNNVSGVMGVCWDKKVGKWASFIHVEGRKHHLGYFSEFGEAVTARKSAERLHKFHPNHGREASKYC